MPEGDCNKSSIPTQRGNIRVSMKTAEVNTDGGKGLYGTRGHAQPRKTRELEKGGYVASRAETTTISKIWMGELPREMGKKRLVSGPPALGSSGLILATTGNVRISRAGERPQRDLFPSSAKTKETIIRREGEKLG